MRFLLLLLLVLIVPAHYAAAQETSTALPGKKAPELSIDEQLGLTKRGEGRKSTGNLKRDYALKYYDECLKRKHAYISQAGKELLCGCTSQRMETDLSYEDVVALFNDKDKAPDVHRELLQVSYGQCIRHPVNLMVYNDCMNMDALKPLGQKAQHVVCKCQSDTMSRFLTINGQDVVRLELSRNPENVDPLGSYLASDSFRLIHDSHFKRCMDIHVYGYR